MAAAAILDFGPFSTSDLNDIGCHVIPLFKGFTVYRVQLLSYFYDAGSK